jgi:hypothetical protein
MTAIMILDKDYGAFAPIVSSAGTILAMGAALTLGWKGRARWEPVEEDVPRAPQKVAGLVAALMVVLIWVQWNAIQYKGTLTRLVIGCSITLIASLVVYGLLNGLTYTAVRKKKGEPAGSTQTEEIKVIGGLWLNKNAREHVGKPEGPQVSGQPRAQILTVQRMFALSEYVKDEVWSRPSQQLASMLFTLGYLGLIVAGTVALGSGAILTGLVMKK